MSRPCRWSPRRRCLPSCREISTRLFTYCCRFSLPGFSRNEVPLADPPIEPLPPAPAAPEVALPVPLVPDVELPVAPPADELDPVAPPDEPPPMRALVSMNCPPPPPLGRLEPVVAPPPLLPVAPAVELDVLAPPAESPDCRHPVTVTWPPDRDSGSLSSGTRLSTARAGLGRQRDRERGGQHCPEEHLSLHSKPPEVGNHESPAVQGGVHHRAPVTRGGYCHPVCLSRSTSHHCARATGCTHDCECPPDLHTRSRRA